MPDNIKQADNIKQEEQKRMLDFLSESISIPSVKGQAEDGAPFGSETLRALKHFLAQAEKDGFRTANCAGYAGYVEFGPQDAGIIAAICHLDVVPVGEWTEAFQAEYRDGKLFGRGSSDDKGPAVAVYYALKRLKEKGYAPKCRLRLILGLDEESGSECMAYYSKHEELPLAAFTPDACFPVIHAEKGILHFTLSMKAKQNPADPLQLRGAEAGSRANVIPGECVLNWQGEVGTQKEVITGIMGHASMPELGKNAISLAMEAAYEKLSAASSAHPFVSFYHEQIGLDTNGQLLGIAQNDAVSGELTFNAGVLELDENSASLTCDIRYPVNADSVQIVETIKSRLQNYHADFSLLSHAAPLYLPVDHPLVATLQDVYTRLSGSEIPALAIGGGTYARSIPNTLAFGGIFPGEAEMAHQNGEYVDVENLQRSIDYYEAAFCALDERFATS